MQSCVHGASPTLAQELAFNRVMRSAQTGPIARMASVPSFKNERECKCAHSPACHNRLPLQQGASARVRSLAARDHAASLARGRRASTRARALLLARRSLWRELQLRVAALRRHLVRHVRVVVQAAALAAAQRAPDDERAAGDEVAQLEHVTRGAVRRERGGHLALERRKARTALAQPRVRAHDARRLPHRGAQLLSATFHK